MSSVLNRVAKWAIFVLNRIRVWRPWGHPPTQTSLECPPGKKHSIYLKILIMVDYLGFNVGSASLLERRKHFMICMAYLNFLMSTVFKCSSAECILTRRCSPSSNYPCISMSCNKNKYYLELIVNPIYWGISRAIMGLDNIECREKVTKMF